MESKSIGLEIKKLDNLILRKLIVMTKSITDVSLSPTQIMLIKYISEHNNSVYQKDIEHFVQFRKSTLSGILDTMEKNGLIKRSNSKEDLRSKEIHLTDKANKIYNNLIIIESDFQKSLSSGITHKELNTFYSVIDKIKENLKGGEDEKII